MPLKTQELDGRIARILSRPTPATWSPTGLTRDDYLDLMETILQTAAAWQNADGAIIDPVDRAEHGQTSCRFVAPGAILLSAGRAANLREKILLGMDWCCMRLATGQAKSPDFWTRELMTAWNLLQDTDPARRAKWEQQIRSVIPERTYRYISPDGSKLRELHNWAVYASAGEAMRQQAGLGPVDDDGTVVWGHRYFDKYMAEQLWRFSDHGMYRDPNDPMTYDMTTRLQIATAFEVGFTSSLQAELDQFLRCGGMAQLLYVSPDGYSPFGGRSGQMHLQEAILAALAELEARRYRGTNDRLSQAFKRQAHRSVASITRWIRMSPMRHVKNGFDPSTRHGCEDYAKWSVYSLFIASCLGLAWQFADDTIPEAPMPSELGGYVLELQPAFHKVFAVVDGTQIEIDTAADLHYDATGLGRFHRAGLPAELGLGMPLPAHPNYRVPADLLPDHDMAIGVGWQTADGQWTDLASLSEGLDVTTDVLAETAEAITIVVRWRHAASETGVEQRYELTSGRLTIRVKVTRADALLAVRFTVPLLVTDGDAKSTIERSAEGARVTYRGGRYTVRHHETYRQTIERPVANRNGIYQPLVLERAGDEIGVELALDAIG